MIAINYGPKFNLGQVVITSNAAREIPADDVQAALRRHSQGDWGELDENDWATNQEALQSGNRLLSAYTTNNGVRFWIITEADRSVTTVLLPEDY